MKLQLAFLALALAATTGCDRGPEIPANAEPPSTTPSGAAPRGPMAQQGAPQGAGSAPEGALPPGHPGVGGAGGAPATAFDAEHPSVAGVAWTAPQGMTSRAPNNSMRAAEYAVAGEAGEAVMAVYYFPGMGGSIEENVQRWVAQFAGADGQPPAGEHSRTLTVGGLTATRVDVSGRYNGMGGDGDDGQRLLGLIVQGPNGPVFFKLVGPAATVTAAEANFDAFAQSIHPAG